MITATLTFTLPLRGDTLDSINEGVTGYYLGYGNTDLEALLAATTNFHISTFGHAHLKIQEFVERALRYTWGDALTYDLNHLWVHIRHCIEGVKFQNTDVSGGLDFVSLYSSVPIFSTPETRGTVTIGQR